MADPCGIKELALGPESIRRRPVRIRLTAPSPHIAEAGETFRDIVTQKCGGLDSAYVAAFVKENGVDPAELETLQAGRTYQLPACLWNRHVDHLVKPQENPDKIFRQLNIPFAAKLVTTPDEKAISPITRPLRETMLAQQSVLAKSLDISRRGFDGSEFARAFTMRNQGVDPTSLNKLGPSTLSVPEQRRSGIVELRDGFDTADAKRAIERLLTPAAHPTDWTGTGWAKSAPGDFVSEVSPATLIGPVDYGGACTWPAGSPIPLGDLRAARAENELLRSASPRKAKVLVIDTGYDARLREPAISPEDLGSVKAFHGDDDQNSYRGFNPLMAMRYADPSPPDGLAYPLHGSEVAATLLGGSFLQTSDRADRVMEVVFASMAKGAELKSEGANLALDHATYNRIDIVNASFVAQGSPISFVAALRSSRPSILLITAAGNVVPGAETNFAPSDESWPGRLGGKSADRLQPGLVVSVGGHDPAFRILPFSRAGEDHIDLLAPGCNVPTYTVDAAGNVEKASRSGTSYAAPIVTLVAAELFNEGMTTYRIRNRLIFSVDIDRDLEGIVQSSGILNVRKALSVYRDFFELDEIDPATGRKRVVTGTLDSGTDGVTCDNVKIPYASIYKLAFAGSRSNPGAAKRNYIWYKAASDDDRGLRFRRCAPEDLAAAPKLHFRNAASGADDDIDLGQLSDFVARSFDATSG